MRIEKSIKNLVYATMSKVVGLILNFVIRTIIIYKLGVDYLGIDAVFANILSLLSLAELGVGGVVVSILYEPVAKENYTLIKSIIRLLRNFYLIIGAIVLVAGASCAFIIPSIANGTVNISENIILIYSFYLLNTLISYFSFYKSTIFLATQRQFVESRNNLIFTSLLRIFQIIVLLLTSSFIVYLLLMPVFSLMSGICLSFLISKNYPFLKGKAEKLTRKQFKEIAKRTLSAISYKLGGVLISSGDNIVISVFLGLAIVGIYSNYSFVLVSVTSIIGMLTGSIMASVGNAVVLLTKQEVKQIFNKAMYIIFMVVSVCSVCLFVLINPFIELWVGTSFVLPMNIVTVLIVNFFITQNRAVVDTFKFSAGLYVKDKFRPLIEGAVNLVTSIILANYLGILGVALGTLISALAVSVWNEVYILYKYLFHSPMREYFIKYVFYIFITIFTLTVIYFICLYLPVRGWGGLIVKGFISLIGATGSLVAFTFWTPEFKYFINICKRFFHLKKETKDNKEEIKEMKIEKTNLPGVKKITPQVFGDNRGWFMETYSDKVLKESGVDIVFVQDNQSFSSQKGILRGLHFQNNPMAQTKLIRCTKGSILDVGVDMRKGSDHYLQYVSVELNEENKTQLLIPQGFAHGFLTLTDNVEVQYKVDNFYDKDCDRGIQYCDPRIGIEWGIESPILSQKDIASPMLYDSDCNFTVKVLVTGVNGQLGHDMIKKLIKEGYECKGVDKSDFDITDEQATLKYIKEYNPYVVIHCAAYTAVDKAETDKELCHLINVVGSANIAKACKDIDAKMVYISTDYVYNGKGEKPFETDGKISPLSVYGKTKYDGEEACRKYLTKLFVVRTSWVFGINGNNFVKTMLRLAKEKDSISVVDDQIGSPTYTVDLADFLFFILNTQKYGTYNCSNEGYCSWYDFAKEIFQYTNTKVELRAISSAQYKTAAKRPFNSRLNKASLEEVGFGKMPNWKDSLTRYLIETEEIKK